MRTAILYYYLLITLHFVSCSNGLKKVENINEATGMKEVYYIDQDSMIQGEKLLYVNEGKVLLEKSEYVDGVLDGIREIYFENGNAEIKETYKQGLLTDTLYVYYSNGEVKLKTPYVNGVLNGTVLQYYESGMLKEEVTYIDNQENGAFTEYHENGQVKWRGEYLNGDNEFGLLQEYNEDGQLIKKMSCDSLAICRTIWTVEKGDIVPL